MPTCSNCKEEIKEGSEFCPSCGKEIVTPYILKNKNGKPILSYEDLDEKFTNLSPLPIRKEYLWTILTILTGGILGIVYLILNFKDLNKLDKFPKIEQMESIETTGKKFIFGFCTCSLLTLGIFAIFYPFYLKFNLLSEYLEKHPIKQQTEVLNGMSYAMLIIFFLLSLISGLFISDVFNLYTIANHTVDTFLFILGIIFLVVAGGLFFVLIYQNLSWQQAYNERAKMVNKYIKE